MRLKDLIKGVKGISVTGSADIHVRGMAIDSRKVEQEYLFMAIKGSLLDGHEFIEAAINNGAKVILCSVLPSEIQDNVTYIIADNPAETLGAICNAFYGDPSSNLNIIGITGTNGKTSIATWLYNLGETLGFPCGLISTIRIKIRKEEYPSSHTTPDIISLFSTLKSMMNAGCEYVFMEVSSHALDQNRTAGIEFSGTVFTNISRDHLDYHKDFLSYINAKKKLFDGLTKKAFALINADDRNSSVMVQNTDAKVIRYSTRSISDYTAKLVEQISQGMMLEINGDEVWVPFIGSFNASNLAAVYGVGIELGWEKTEVLTGISSMNQVDGRFEKFDLGEGITGIVDYAHTPDALSNVLETIRELCTPNQRIVTVIGAGGDRDKGKRPEMAGVACGGSEIVILTSDNPRSEDPDDIIRDMKAGVPANMESQVFSLPNRREAIKLAFALSREGDFILVAGKGHENYQEIKGEKHFFDDREELLNIKASNNQK